MPVSSHPLGIGVFHLAAKIAVPVINVRVPNGGHHVRVRVLLQNRDETARAASRRARHPRAGIAAAATGNGFEDIAADVRYAADNGARVIILSLGALQGVQALVVTGLIFDLQEAIRYAYFEKGAAVIAAAGSDAVPVCNTPGFDDGAVYVVATDRRKAPSAHSSASGAARPEQRCGAWGSAAHRGEEVLSLVPSGEGKAECGGTDKYYDGFAARRYRTVPSPHAPWAPMFAACSPPSTATHGRCDSAVAAPKA